MPGPSDEATKVIARALVDSTFRDALVKDPEGTMRIAFPGLSQSDVQSIKDLKPEEWSQLSLNDLNTRLGSVASWRISEITS